MSYTQGDFVEYQGRELGVVKEQLSDWSCNTFFTRPLSLVVGNHLSEMK